MDGAGRHHDHGPVGQPELFLPARENVSSGRRKQQIVLRSAIFLIRKGALRPPAGSAAPARPERARGPWGDGY